MFVFENVDAEDKAALKAKDDPSIPGKLFRRPMQRMLSIPTEFAPLLRLTHCDRPDTN